MIALQRYIYKPDAVLTGIPNFILKMVASKVKQRSKAQGYGLHSQDEGIF